MSLKPQVHHEETKLTIIINKHLFYVKKPCNEVQDLSNEITINDYNVKLPFDQKISSDFSECRK